MTTDESLVAEAKLLLEIDNPNYDEVWLEGYEESLADIEESANPYPEGSKEFEYWSEGWWAACYGEEPLFDYEGHVVGSTETAAPKQAEPAAPKHRIRTLGQVMSGVLFGSALAAVTMDLFL